MRAAIHNPYLDTLGGGERYSMAVADALIKEGHQVDVEWKNESIKKALEERFGIVLKDVRFVKDIKKGNGYDICFWISDGSIPLLGARKNLLHFQFPFKDINGKTLLNRMKFFRINKVICNSKFTKKYIDSTFEVKSAVVYPPVAVSKFKPKRKDNLIISVGRFSQLTQSKRQDVLVRAFKKLFDSGYKDWKMILAGGSEVGAINYIQRLKKASHGYPIKIVESPKFRQLVELYNHAKIYWAATGFRIDENKDPIKVEHFGITVVEAMAAKAVPVVYSAGGHKEIVKDGENGYLWKDTRQLLKKTEDIINNKKLAKEISKNAISSSKRFGIDRFEMKISKFI